MKAIVLFFVSPVLLIVLNYVLTALFSSPFIYQAVEQVYRPDYLVIPGAGNPDDDKNEFFKSRVEAAHLAHEHFPTVPVICIGRTDGVIYREPEELQAALIARHLPDSLILTDSGGMNTFRMLLTLKERYPGRLLFISQRLHLERILFASRCLSLPAEGLEVKATLSPFNRQYLLWREFFARVRMTYHVISYKIRQIMPG
jgi:vancomycin permeability regulator SanA